MARKAISCLIAVTFARGLWSCLFHNKHWDTVTSGDSLLVKCFRMASKSFKKTSVSLKILSVFKQLECTFYTSNVFSGLQLICLLLWEMFWGLWLAVGKTLVNPWSKWMDRENSHTRQHRADFSNVNFCVASSVFSTTNEFVSPYKLVAHTSVNRAKTVPVSWCFWI